MHDLMNLWILMLLYLVLVFKVVSNQVTVAETNVPTLLDSGTTISYFPQNLLDLIASSLDAFYSCQHGDYIMRCVSENDLTVLVFDFGGFYITVTLVDFQSKTTYSHCLLLMGKQSNKIILGDVFL